MISGISIYPPEWLVMIILRVINMNNYTVWDHGDDPSWLHSALFSTACAVANLSEPGSSPTTTHWEPLQRRQFLQCWQHRIAQDQHVVMLHLLKDLVLKELLMHVDLPPNALPNRFTQQAGSSRFPKMRDTQVIRQFFCFETHGDLGNAGF